MKRQNLYLAAALAFGWLIVVRSGIIPLAPRPAIDQSALVRGEIPSSWQPALSAAIHAFGPALIISAILAIRLRRLTRGKRGRCPACGYPTGTSPVCTECGREVTKARERPSAV